MRQFRVVLRGPQGSSPDASAQGAWRTQVEAFTSCRDWFAPEEVRVRLARPVQAPAADWELSLVPRAAALTLAATGVLGGLSGSAEAAVRPGLSPLPASVASSSVRTFTPTDRQPEVVLVEAREVRSSDSFGFTPGAPLTDARGNPILIAAYHSNTPDTPHGNVDAAHTNTSGTPHTNTTTAHSNTAWTNHSNTPGGHTNAGWANHSNSTPGTHVNMVQGDYVF